MMEYLQRAKELVGQMTLPEKAAFVSGRDMWNTVAIERLGIPSICMTDGPHGLRLAKAEGGADIFASVPATCFPTASALASSWDVAIAARVGEAIAAECHANNVQVILGPGVNMKRSPLAGRNFEYYSEDPVLSGEMAAAQIRATEDAGIGTSLKHYIANEQEFERFTNSSEMSERTLREVNLAAFERAVAEKPWSIMASYNYLDSVKVTENSWLLQDLLRDELQYKGVLVSDWGAITHPVASLRAGMTLEMPGPGVLSAQKIVQAVTAGELPESDLDERVAQLLSSVLAVDAKRRPEVTFSVDEHDAIARQAAQESIVLLKNHGKILPLDLAQQHTVAVIGQFAAEPRFQGGGSSQITPTKTSSLLESMRSAASLQAEVSFAAGYKEDGTTTDGLLAEAVETARHADVAIVVVGLPKTVESEGFDHTNFSLPEDENRLITAIAAVQKQIIVVITTGSAVAMPWIKQTPVVLQGWLAGQASGAALVDVLLGAVNPSGKLSETFPVRLEDTPAFPDFPARGGTAVYREGIFAGYRHYDVHGIRPLFPFGFGLSYTTFHYESIRVSAASFGEQDELTVTVNVKNVGSRAGKEVVQLYVAPTVTDDGERRYAPKQLRAFTKVFIQPGQSEQIQLKLRARDFSYYDTIAKAWRLQPGRHTILVGGSSVDLPLSQQVSAVSEAAQPLTVTRETLFKHLPKSRGGKDVHDAFSHIMPPAFVPFIYDMPLDRILVLLPHVTEDTIDAIVGYCNDPENGPDIFSILGSFK